MRWQQAKPSSASSKIEKPTPSGSSQERMEQHLNELMQVCTGAFDLRQTFDNVNKPIFYDQIHVSDHGNMLIADKIYEKIIDLKIIIR